MNGWTSKTGIGTIKCVGNSGIAFQRNRIALPVRRIRKSTYRDISENDPLAQDFFGVYQDYRILLVEQIPTQPFAFCCNSASSRKTIKRSEAIWHMQTQQSMQPANRGPPEGRQLAEEGDKGEKGDGNHRNDDVAKDSHSLHCGEFV